MSNVLKCFKETSSVYSSRFYVHIWSHDFQISMKPVIALAISNIVILLFFYKVSFSIT